MLNSFSLQNASTTLIKSSSVKYVCFLLSILKASSAKILMSILYSPDDTYLLDIFDKVDKIKDSYNTAYLLLPYTGFIASLFCKTPIINIGNAGTNEEPLRTRLPIVDELGDGSNSFLYYNLNVPAEEWDNPPLGYWTLSSSMGDYQFVYSLMIERGIADDLLVGNSFMIGIRPVITLNF